MPSGKKRKRHKMATHKRKKRLRKNRHKKKKRSILTVCRYCRVNLKIIGIFRFLTLYAPYFNGLLVKRRSCE